MDTYYISKSNTHVVCDSIEELQLRGLNNGIEIKAKDRFDAQCKYHVQNFEKKTKLKFLWWENNNIGFKAVFENNHFFYFHEISKINEIKIGDFLSFNYGNQILHGIVKNDDNLNLIIEIDSIKYEVIKMVNIAILEKD